MKIFNSISSSNFKVLLLIHLEFIFNVWYKVGTQLKMSPIEVPIVQHHLLNNHSNRLTGAYGPSDSYQVPINKWTASELTDGLAYPACLSHYFNVT